MSFRIFQALNRLITPILNIRLLHTKRMRWFEAILVLNLGLGVVSGFFTTLPPPPLVAKVLLLSV